MAAAVTVESLEELGGGAATVQAASAAGGALYMLGTRPAQADAARLIGLAGDVGWSGAAPSNLEHAALIQGQVCLPLPCTAVRC